ncbi:iron complex outermembrane recepter protein [Dyella sp. OK004]|uniref:TonB-dependent siderophore receptor n=1 Tax=Dyella sp. OK004 TaxID=1855292 RepID=UPI0008F03308|nr:TonB-dependent receptor [Dyella sp. OK004]SFS07008.1 iron complex outermembrane recepter protein [Dyella sp. OK004]
MRYPVGLSALGLVAACAHAQAGQVEPTVSTLQSIDVQGHTDKGLVGQRVGVGAFRDQSIMDVPATINVATRDLLDAQADVSLYDVLRNTAGVTRQQLSGEVFDNLSMRGVTLDNRSNYRLNGSLPLLNLTELPLEDKERVEVLKGVSALYYGYTAPGGVVNMVTKRAGNQPVTTLGLSIDNNGGTIGQLDVGRRFGDHQQYGARFNLAGGSLQSPVDGIDGDKRMASAALDWRVNDRLNLRADLEYFRKKLGEQSVITQPAAKNGSIELPRMPDPSKRLSPDWADFVAHGGNVLLHADYAVSAQWLATLEAGRADLTRDRRAFTEIRNYNPLTGRGTLAGNRQSAASWNNQNLRAELFGSFATGAVGHELTIGAAQTKSNQDQTVTGQFTGAQNLYDPITVPWLPVTKTTVTPALNAVDRGLYVTDRMSFSEHWQTILGARYTRYTSDQGSNHYKASKTTPLAALIYKFNPRLMAYASYATGIEQGDRAPNTAINVNEALPPSISKQKEVGLRWQPSDRLLLSSAVFDIDRAASYVNDSGLFVQSGRLRYRGIELNAQGQLSHDWSLQFSTQYLQARFRDISTALEDKTPENTPAVTASLFAEYAVPVVPGLALNGGLYFTGRRPLNNANQGYIDNYTLVGLGARYATQMLGKRVLWQLNVENATDKRYWAATGNNRLAMGLPRTAKLTVKIDL